MTDPYDFRPPTPRRPAAKAEPSLTESSPIDAVAERTIRRMARSQALYDEAYRAAVRPKACPTRADVLAVLPHDTWCKAGGTDHAGCCPDEITECACIASDSLNALVVAGLIEVAP